MTDRFTPEQLHRLGEFLDEAMALLKILAGDVRRHADLATPDDRKRLPHEDDEASSPLQQARRDHVRACFAFFEAHCFVLKRFALLAPDGVSVEDHLLCTEQDVDIDAKGKVVGTRRKLRFLANLRYSFDVFRRSFPAAPACDYADAGFMKLRDSIQVRDRLMHPKRQADLRVTAAENLQALEAFAWFLREFTKIVFPGVAPILDRHIADFQEPP